MQMEKIKKALKPKDFFNFLLDNGENTSKNIGEKIEESFWRRVGKTKLPVQSYLHSLTIPLLLRCPPALATMIAATIVVAVIAASHVVARISRKIPTSLALATPLSLLTYHLIQCPPALVMMIAAKIAVAVIAARVAVARISRKIPTSLALATPLSLFTATTMEISLPTPSIKPNSWIISAPTPRTILKLAKFITFPLTLSTHPQQTISNMI